MIPRFVEHRSARVGGAIQLSTLFEMNGQGHVILSDTENDKTILTDVPLELGEEVGPLLKGLESDPGIQIELDSGSRIEGYGVFTFPYGPVTSGIAEAGGFRFLTYGERILKIIPSINFKKRGVERRALGMTPHEALLLIERSAGNFSASYSTCFTTAVEQAMGIEAPQAAKWIRAVAVELERIYNHLQIFSREAEAASQNVATNQTSALKERVLRLNSKYFGHRYLFGFNEVGGVSVDLSSSEKRKELYASVRLITNEFSEIVNYFLSSRIFLDRLQSTAKLKKEDALLLGAVGPAARGSGIDWDDRIAYPIEPYDDIFVDISVESGSDVMARIMVRIKEITTSMTTIQQLLDKMPGGNLKGDAKVSTSRGTDSDFSFCRIEGPSGDLIHAVKLARDGRIEKLHIRPASLANWQPFARSLEGNVFTDFQFSFESFGLNYADSDR